MPPVPVLWVSGAPGVGKSTAAWALYRRLRADGRHVAYVDIDQLGLFGPAPSTDRDRHRLQADILADVLTTFVRHGARQLIVSGVADPRGGTAPDVGRSPWLDFTLVRLRCSHDELRRRYLGRGSTEERLDELRSLADAYDRNDVGIAVDTTNLSPDDVADALEDLTQRAVTSETDTSAELPPQPDAVRTGTPVLLVVGPTAVGKSTLGWSVLSTVWERGIPAAYVDVDQLGFRSPEANTQVKAENLARAWAGYHHAGARALIVVARGIPDLYTRALAGENVITVALHASPVELANRVARRAKGEGPRLAGDSLLDAPPWRQNRIADRAADEAKLLGGHVANCGSVVNTDGVDDAMLAAHLLALLDTALAADDSL